MEVQETTPTEATVQFLTNQIKILRAELKNIRQKQKQAQISTKKMVLEVQDRLESGLKIPSEDEPVQKLPHTELLSDGSYNLKPISFIKSCYKSKNGTPRQANLCAASRASLQLSKDTFTNPEHAIAGLQEYSHVWLLFVFHQNTECGAPVKAKIKSPRLDGASAGVFATRSPHRPCPIGLSLCKLESIKDDTLYLSGVDLVNGTPVLDIKPYIPRYDNPTMDLHTQPVENCLHDKSNSIQSEKPSEVSSSPVLEDSNLRVASWIQNSKVPTLHVLFTERAEKQLSAYHHHSVHQQNCAYCLEFIRSGKELRSAIVEILCEDPRSVYRRHKCSDRLYYFSLELVHVTCWFDDTEPIVEVLRIKSEKSCQPSHISS